MEHLEVKTDTAQKRDTIDSVTGITIDADKLKFWRRFWRSIVVVLILVFILIIIILLATSKDITEDDTKQVATDTPTPSPIAFETPPPTAHYLDTISFPLSNNFRIQSYNDPTGSSSIITKPRAIRSAYYDGATILYIGSSSYDDNAYVMIDYDSDGLNDAEFIIFESSSVGSDYSPASLALSSDGNSDLYISLTNMIVKCNGNVHQKVLAFTSSDDRLSDCNKILDIPLTIEDEDKPWNLRRYIGISNTNQLCVSNGMTCDNCAHETIDISFPHGTIICFHDSSTLAMINTNMSDINDPNIIIKADGVRNSVGFDWHNDNDAFYFTDNGRDEVHENYPDDELNYVGNNNHFGFPNCHSLGSGPIVERDINCEASYIDPNISNPSSINCSMYERSLQPLGPHVVPLGMRFYTGSMFPTDFMNVIFIAERGNGFNSSYGYRIVVMKLSEDGSEIMDHVIFADGFYDYNTNKENGRPVEVAILNDGSLLISDDNDNGGAIYRVEYTGNKIDQYLQSSTSTANCNFSYAN